MRIVILTLGSRGDVQPYLALGLGLQQSGHHVRIGTNTDFETFVRSRGLDFAPVAGSFRTLLDSEEGRRWMATDRGGMTFLRRQSHVLRPVAKSFLNDCWTACQGAEAIIYTPLGFAGWHIAQKLGVPCAYAHYNPFSFTRVSPNLFGLWRLRATGILNQQIQLLGQRLIWRYMGPAVNRWRRDTLGLPPLPSTGPDAEIWRHRVPFLYGYSPSVVPTPQDWPPWYHVTGYWFLDRPADWQPPADLVAFLDAGPPPVYLGFGSMIPQDPAALTSMACEALQRIGQRGILHAGWGGLGKADLPDTVFLIQDVPHDWLFPRMAAVVHHGGAGSTAAGLRAGVPSVITPFFYDQPYWGARVAALGVGPRPIPMRRLSAERLAAALQAATGDADMRARATALSKQIQTEDGVTRAVEAFHDHLYTAG